MSTRFMPLLGSLFLVLLGPTTAIAQSRLWARQFGTVQVDEARAAISDGDGGTLIAGFTSGNLGGPSAGSRDGWLARYDGAGTRLWLRQFGTVGHESVWALAPDGAGGIFLGGEAQSGDFGGPAAPEYDAWVARFDGSGTQIWVRRLGTAGWDYTHGLAPDGAGGVFAAGYTSGALGGPSSGSQDAWLARYDADGTQLWIRQFGTDESDFAGPVAPDGAGGVFVAGYTQAALGGPHVGHWDAWLARYDGDGNRVWIIQFGTTLTEWMRALAPDGAGGVFMAGSTYASLGAPVNGQPDVWVARYSGGGQRVWLRQFGGVSVDSAYALAPDGAGGVFVGGDTFQNLAAPSAGMIDPWLAHYNSAGNLRWIRQFGTAASDYVFALTSDGGAGVLVAGVTEGSLGGMTAGGRDAWLARYDSTLSCTADWDADGTANSTDISTFLAAWLASVQAGILEADFNTDGLVNSSDISAFLTSWLAAIQTGC